MHRKRLRYFLAVAEEEHFHRAAQRLHVAQSALSRHMRALEEELGFALFTRLSRGTALTNAGRVFKEEAAQALHVYERAIQRAQSALSGAVGSLNIGINEVAAKNTKVSSLLRMFREEYPDINLNLHFLHSQEQVDKLRDVEIDVGFVFFSLGNDQFLDRHKLDVDSYELFIPPGHRLAHKKSIYISDLDNEKFVVNKQKLNRYYWDISIGRVISGGYAPIIVQEADNLSAIVSFVSVGLGLSFLHRSYGAREVPNIVVRAVSDLTIKLDLDVIWRRDNRSETLQQFISFLKRPISC